VAAALGQILVDTYRRCQLAVDVIVPVPLHASRLRERGYNQSELLAWEVSRAIGLPVNTSALERARKTKSQMTLGAAERHQNVVAAFSCSKELARQNVLLIDDVCTTGATLDACAAAMKEKGATSVWGLTLAR
jgi:ComF family protein